MAEPAKGVVLNVSGDGRTAENWSAYRIWIINSLAGKVVDGYYLGELIQGEVSAPPNPGTVERAWLDAAPEGQARTAGGFTAAKVAWKNRRRANDTAHYHVMSSLPPPSARSAPNAPMSKSSGPTCSRGSTRRPSSASPHSGSASCISAWRTSMASQTSSLPSPRSSLRSNAQGVRAGWRSLSPYWQEPSWLAWAPGSPLTKDLLDELPEEEQTFDVFSVRLLAAEKNEQVASEIAMLTVGPSVNVYHQCQET